MSEWNPAECVARGIKFLQEHGEDLNRINLDTLLLQYGHHCILGQLHHRYEYGCAAYKLHTHQLEICNLGFQAPETCKKIMYMKIRDLQYAILTDEWRKQLTELRNKSKPSFDIDLTSGSKGLVKEPVAV